MTVMRALPYSMYAHSASLCQCISRMAPALRRMSTPAMLVEMGSSRTVISRVQPPRLQAHVRVGEREAQVRQDAGVGRRRNEEVGVLRIDA